MATIHEAIDSFTTGLHERVKALAGRRGWGARPDRYPIVPHPDRALGYTVTTVHLPGGRGATFTPRPEPVGQTWVIDVRRSDGRVPDSAAAGLTLMNDGGGGWALRGPQGPLTDEALAAVLEELAA